jgi:prepilin-type processing-associated H-X9-DG protein
LTSIALVALLVVPAVGMEALQLPPPATAEPAADDTARPMTGEEIDPIELMRQMGADDDAIMFVQLMSQAMGADVGQMMLLMMLADKGGMDDDLMGMMLFSKMLGGGATKQPIALLQGPALLVIEDGVVYKIDTDTMRIEGKVAYRQKKGAADLTALMPFITHAHGKAQATACLSNMKQLCLATHMYAQEAGLLPTEQWTDQLAAYTGNRALYACPGMPERPVGYAINEAVIGALMPEIRRPAQTVLFYESDPGHDLPFGGPDAVIRQPRHDGKVTVGFVDGHARLISPDELRQLLAQDPFQ